ncbi:MAG: hypothetical protein GY910_06275 [bacterium]|nr:hypothetical protein [bacterium]
MTFVGVMIAWVFFRSASIDTAFALLQAMFLPSSSFWDLAVVNDQGPSMGREFALWLALAVGITWLMPNTQEWISYDKRCCPEVRPDGLSLWSPALSAGFR